MIRASALRTAACLLGLLVPAAASSTWAQTAGPPEPAAVSAAPAAADELAGIRRALDRLAAALESNLATNRATLVLRRIELRERRIDPMRRRLENAREEQENLEEEMAQLRSMRERLLEESAAEIGAGPAEENRRMLGEVDTMLASLASRQEDARLRALTLENDLARSLDDIALLDDRLERLISAIDLPERDR